MRTVPHHFKASEPGSTRPKLRTVLPLVRELVRPRRELLALGFVLMAINRVASLVLPYSTRFLIDIVIAKHQVNLLKPIVFGVLGATLIQGVTSFSLTQLLSKLQTIPGELLLLWSAIVDFYCAHTLATVNSREDGRVKPGR